MYPTNEPKEKETPNPINLGDILKGVVRKGHGENACFIMEWNSNTRPVFDRGRKPRIGNKYVLKCVSFNGKEARFVIEHI